VHLPSQLGLVSAVVILLGGLFLAFATFLSRPWVFAYWVRVAFWMIGLCGVAWAVLKLIMVVHDHSFSRHTYFVLDHYRTLLAGVGIGLLVLFFLSGEAVAGLKKWQELRKGRNPNA
jgi:hypothetical protein